MELLDSLWQTALRQKHDLQPERDLLWPSHDEGRKGPVRRANRDCTTDRKKSAPRMHTDRRDGEYDIWRQGVCVRS